MTVKIKLSAVRGTNFELEVAHFAQAMRDWRVHMNLVAADEKNGVSGIDRHHPYPRPIASEIVDSAIDEDGNPDYEIVDDGPKPEEILAAKKNELFRMVTIAEHAAAAAVAPVGKRRLQNIQEANIRSRMSSDEGLLKKVAGALRGTARKISDEDAAHLQDQVDRRERLAEIELIAAQAHADIEDLTSDTIDGWQIPTFPGDTI